LRIVLTALVSVALLSTPAAPVFTQGYTQGYAKHRYAKKNKHVRRYASPFDGSYVSVQGGNSDYYEHIADKLPFGSALWWRQMDVEGRGGRPRGN
jgi:hypothetical protein